MAIHVAGRTAVDHRTAVGRHMVDRVAPGTGQVVVVAVDTSPVLLLPPYTWVDGRTRRRGSTASTTRIHWDVITAGEWRRLFVMDHGQLVGVVSRRDLLKVFLRSEEIRADIECEVFQRVLWADPNAIRSATDWSSKARSWTTCPEGRDRPISTRRRRTAVLRALAGHRPGHTHRSMAAIRAVRPQGSS